MTMQYIRTGKVVHLSGIVTSETDPSKSYNVHFDGTWSCTCESRRKPCKHIQLVKQSEIQAAQREQ